MLKNGFNLKMNYFEKGKKLTVKALSYLLVPPACITGVPLYYELSNLANFLLKDMIGY